MQRVNHLTSHRPACGLVPPTPLQRGNSAVMKVLKSCCCAALLLLVGTTVSVTAAQSFVEGTHYTRLADRAPARLPEGKVEVREFFWYGCPHCYTLEPYIQSWERPAAVEFVTTPAVLGKNWVAHAYAFYALKALGRLEDLHAPLFEAIHGERKRVFSAGQIEDFVAQQGVDREQFARAVESFSVDTQVKRAERLGKAYGVSGVPAFVINGKYMTSPTMAGSYQHFFKVVDHLIAKESR